MLKDHPCKVTSITTSKAGKHGHAKAVIVGTDIFTDKKYEDMCPTSHNMMIPHVSKSEFAVMDMDNDGYLTIMTEDGETREDLNVEGELKD